MVELRSKYHFTLKSPVFRKSTIPFERIVLNFCRIFRVFWDPGSTCRFGLRRTATRFAFQELQSHVLRSELRAPSARHGVYSTRNFRLGA
ncbi:hypothetical protein M408DRAFT_296060 [Serendipita vermifera MAFF 305830]|uniref:Uncharacterized protein n=1 Tax=Serendipita vermifera MAFF 305830 TaxID=933852 RepID=A0A0C3BFM4_SERVB|nr:hypothetical protein M408DRAFT_296060 [Serendipita vermifera MAFF 305830]